MRSSRGRSLCCAYRSRAKRVDKQLFFYAGVVFSTHIGYNKTNLKCSIIPMFLNLQLL